MKNKLSAVKNRIRSKSVYGKIQSTISFLALTIFLVASSSFKVQASSQTLDEARAIIRDNYVTPVSDSVLNAPTIEEIVKGLNDPYSQYFSKQQEEDFLNSIDNKMYGIGISVEMVAEGVKVKAVIDNSPALESGIHEGDIIISANDKSLAGLKVEEATSYIKGESGTTVKLQVKRADAILSFSVMRREISLPTVTGKMLSENTAYINIVSFGGDTSQLFSKKLQELNMKNPHSYIIDLRNNGGGYMGTALEIAGNFIGSNPAITVEDREGNKVRYLAGGKGITIDKPVIFLINEYTASASEILSAAVKDYKKAFFIGVTTYGKGVAQQMFPLSDGSALKITTEKFYSPLGNAIQKVGVTPDFEAKDVDSLAVAELFSGKCMNDVDKRGYVKVNYAGKDFEINLNLAKDEKHWGAFKYILNKVSKDNVYVGTDKGWVKAPTDYFDNAYKFLYANYKYLDTLKDVAQNKVFTISFNKEVNADTVKDYTNMEFIDGETGQRVAFDVKKADDKKISIVPKENLKSGKTYYIKIKDVIRPVTVK
ncbi:S41 family peptidase [Clostridium aciditolerans]|uniref:PDZ domain-containing protein n=1 Tax=Clostridium aciditolerans TaxID=339861 RepID=A0A934I098_9CLOT|nr:S41 family peptidase [Clostridium aciditolerans]MBI6873670.1 PDZ domain-containing protein [Clostridium aciditolerans]